MEFTYLPGATPLDLNEAGGLIPDHITLQHELNEWEQKNILLAEKWAFAKKRNEILTISFCLQVHKKMFDKTWQWAGQFRKSDKSIGIDKKQIAMQLKLLLDDIQYKNTHAIIDDIEALDEIATHFHHRLVSIHPFPNGNGRHARLYTDVLLFNLNAQPFTWGSATLNLHNDVRKRYIQALQAADRGDITALKLFVRS